MSKSEHQHDFEYGYALALEFNGIRPGAHYRISEYERQMTDQYLLSHGNGRELSSERIQTLQHGGSIALDLSKWGLTEGQNV